MSRTLVNTLHVCMALLLAAGCPGEGSPAADGTPPAEQGPNELGFADTAPVDGPATDGPATDAPPVGDGLPPGDGPPVADGPLADGAAPVDKGPKPDGATTCSGDQDCKVFEDCCKCNAVFTWQNPGMCKMACTDKACMTKLNLVQPEAYCVKGSCFLGDGSGCSSDSDCKLVNDCCNCLALPVAIATPGCSITACLVSTCTASLVPSAQAKCVSGVCRLVP